MIMLHFLVGATVSAATVGVDSFSMIVCDTFSIDVLFILVNMIATLRRLLLLIVEDWLMTHILRTAATSTSTMLLLIFHDQRAIHHCCICSSCLKYGPGRKNNNNQPLHYGRSHTRSSACVRACVLFYCAIFLVVFVDDGR
jgi:hypothetical protein